MSRKARLGLLCLLVLASFPGQAQDTLYRWQRPLVAKLGFEGFGLDLAIGTKVGIEVSSLFYYHTGKIRFYVLTQNATPFIGLGIGSFPGFARSSQGNKWVAMQLGWEHAYEIFIIQLYLQRRISETNNSSKFPPWFGLNVGVRVDILSRHLTGR